MRLCLDEHYSPQIARDLRARGHDVQSVQERPDLRGLSDEELLAVMTREQRALLTEDVADFAPIVRRLLETGEPHHGIVYSSSRSLPRSRASVGLFTAALDALLRRYPGEHDFINRIEWLTPAG